MYETDSAWESVRSFSAADMLALKYNSSVVHQSPEYGFTETGYSGLSEHCKTNNQLLQSPSLTDS